MYDILLSAMDNTPQKQLIMIYISLLSTWYNNSVIACKVIKTHPEIPSKHIVLLFSYHSEQHADELPEQLR